MDVIEEQLGFPARKGGLILMATEIEFLLIEDILKYEGTLYGNMKRWEGGIVKRKTPVLEGNHSNSYCRFLIKHEK